MKRLLLFRGVGTLLVLAAIGVGVAALDGAFNSAPTNNNSHRTTSTSTYSHIVVVIEENLVWLGDSQSAPYLNGLASAGVAFTNYHGVTHPSEPNYMALLSGSTQGTDGSDNCISSNAQSLVGLATQAGITIKGYIENLGQGYPYACKHDPFSQFADATSAETDFSNWPTDFNQLPQISIVVPNLQNDMHDNGVGSGDSWAQAHMDSYAKWTPAHNSLLIVITDENSSSGNNSNTSAFAYGAGIPAGSIDSNFYSHYDLLRTLEDLYGLAHLGASSNATDMIVAPVTTTSSTTTTTTTTSTSSTHTAPYVSPTNRKSLLNLSILEGITYSAAIDFLGQRVVLDKATNHTRHPYQAYLARKALAKTLGHNWSVLIYHNGKLESTNNG